MKMSPQKLNFAAGLLVGVALCLAAGAWVRHGSAPHNDGAGWQGEKLVRPVHAASLPPSAAGQGMADLKKLSAVLSVSDPLERTRALISYIDSLAPGAFREALDYCRAQGMPATSEDYAMLVTAWSKVDREAALAYVGVDPVSVKTVLGLWSSTNPEAAHEWVEQNCGRNDPNPLMGIVIPAIAGEDEDRALDLIRKLRPSDRWFVFYRMMPRIAAQGPAAVREWVGRLPDKFQGEAVGQLVSSLPASSAAEAVQWLKDYPDAIRTSNPTILFRSWAGEDLEAATASFESLPQGQLHRDALRGLVFHQVGKGDPDAALALIERFPEEVDDLMLERWAGAASASQPEKVLGLIPRIRDGGLRITHYEKALRSWLEVDPDSAREWIATNELPEAVKTEFAGR